MNINKPISKKQIIQSIIDEVGMWTLFVMSEFNSFNEFIENEDYYENSEEEGKQLIELYFKVFKPNEIFCFYMYKNENDFHTYEIKQYKFIQIFQGDVEALLILSNQKLK